MQNVPNSDSKIEVASHQMRTFLLMFVLHKKVMDTSAIFSFINELSRCEYSPHSGDSIESFKYNGITYNEGVESYDIKLKSMLKSFKDTLMEIALNNGSQSILNTIIADVARIEEKGYDIPDSKHLASIEEEYKSNKNEALLRQIKEVSFLNEMVVLQKGYLNEAKEYIYTLQGRDTQTIEKPAKEEIRSQTGSDDIIKGVAGLADYLHVGKTKAQAIINSKLLEENKIQFEAGGLRFKKGKLDALLEENPNVFRDIRCPHKSRN